MLVFPLTNVHKQRIFPHDPAFGNKYNSNIKEAAYLHHIQKKRNCTWYLYPDSRMTSIEIDILLIYPGILAVWPYGNRYRTMLKFPLQKEREKIAKVHIK